MIARICVAGHPPPVVLRSDGSLRWIRGHGGLLGVFDDAQLAEDELRLAPGDTLILYTDGVIEERGAQGPFGEEGTGGRPHRGSRCHGIGDRRPDRGSGARAWVR